MAGVVITMGNLDRHREEFPSAFAAPPPGARALFGAEAAPVPLQPPGRPAAGPLLAEGLFEAPGADPDPGDHYLHQLRIANRADAAAIEDHLRVTGTPPHVHAGNSDQQLAALSAASGKNPGHFKMVDAEKRADTLLRDQALAAARAGTGLAAHQEGMRGTGVVNRPRRRGLAAVTGAIPAPGEHADASEGQHRRQVFNQPRTG